MNEKPLPMAPGCALDETGLRMHLERYRSVGHGASVIDQTGRRLYAISLALGLDMPGRP
jgi:hypothetical protein